MTVSFPVGQPDTTNSRLLSPGEHMEGVRIATVMLRPVRAALLVPNDKPSAMLAAIRSCCLSWGGYANFIIPYSPSGGISPKWKRIVEVLDPERFVSFGSLPTAVEEYLRARNRHAYRADGAGHEVAVVGTSQYSALIAFAERWKPSDDEGRFVAVPDMNWLHDRYLPHAARFGSLQEDVVRILPWHGAYVREGFSYDQLAPVRRFELRRAPGYAHDIRYQAFEVLTGDLGELLPDDEREREFVTLPEETLIGLYARGPSPPTFAPPDPLPVARGSARCIVILSDFHSLEDVALYWNLRADHPFAKPFPLWLPYRRLPRDRFQLLVDQATRKLDTTNVAWSQSDATLHVTSAVMGHEVLEELASERFPDAKALDVTDRIEDFFTGTSRYYVAEQRQPVAFRAGVAHVPRIKPESLEVLDFGIEQVVDEVEVEGVRLPVAAAAGRPAGGERDVTRHGSFRRVGPHRPRRSTDDLLELRVPDGWTLLDSVFRDRGYGCSQSDKSPAARGLISMLGGIEGINVLANSGVYEALKDMCGIKGHQEGEKERDYLAERVAVAHSFFRKPFRGNERANLILRWLVENRVLLRGAEITCRSCKLKRWYEIGSFSERWTCDGCRLEMPIPLKFNQLSWTYRINELYAHGHDQGTVATLLTLYAMHAKWSPSFAWEGFGYHPGVKLTALEDLSLPKEPEIDVVALWGLRLVLAECKASVEHIEKGSDEADDLAKQLTDLVELADHMNANRVIFASPSVFPEHVRNLMYRLAEQSTVGFEWWDRETLLDPMFFRDGTKEPDAADSHMDGLCFALAATFDEKPPKRLSR